MAKISELIKQYFDQSSRGRGLSYYLTGAPTIINRDENRFTLNVKGTKLYTVTLELAGSTYTVSCNCPFYCPHQTPCKHIWAAQLHVESMSQFTSYEGASLSLNPTVSGLPLRKKKCKADKQVDNSYEYDDDEDFEDYDDDERIDPKKTPPAKNVRTIQQQNLVNSIIKPPITRQQPPEPAEWEKVLAGTAYTQSNRSLTTKLIPNEIIYAINPSKTIRSNSLTFEIMQRRKNSAGEWLAPKPLALATNEFLALENSDDRTMLYQLFGMTNVMAHSYRDMNSEAVVALELQHQLIPDLIKTGRFFIYDSQQGCRGPLTIDSTEPWELRLKLSWVAKNDDYLLSGVLHRNNVERALTDCIFATAGGFVFFSDFSVARLSDFGCFQLMTRLRSANAITVPRQSAELFVEKYSSLMSRAPLDMPPALKFEELTPEPTPILKIRKPDFGEKGTLVSELHFKYLNRTISATMQSGSIIDKEQRQIIVRNQQCEAAAFSKLATLGFTSANRSYYDVTPANAFKFPRLPFYGIVSTLLNANWIVEGEGALYRKPGAVSLSVTSGIDWFDLTASCEFDGKKIALPKLLAAIKKGDDFITLDDGTLGMLPNDWLDKYAHIATMGRIEGETIRFKNSQALMVDLLLADQPEARCDETFKKIRDELNGFSGISAVQPPTGFNGELRPYQCEGLGWLLFLQKFGIGGCLADDMGLGKTIQVLALLLMRAQATASTKTGKRKKKPVLIVVPRSLIFNWQREAQRFTPQLTLCDFSHAARKEATDSLNSSDIILVTYGTLRRDITTLKDVEFDYAILDEAQAIKNATTVTAKAVRLINASHRLVLSGTPIENHLGELWALFEFLNPGILGTSLVFKSAESALKRPDDKTVEILRRGLRPFILRRTKAQVAKDLPKKLEETLICEMKPAQRQLYDELKEHYRRSLLMRVKKDGINKAKIQILEALLRLRQAACHPGLIDKKRMSEGSAKLDTLLAQLDEIVQEGHKALVFSQFTTMLAIVKSRLDKTGVVYEYLDGKTHNRQERVDRFQTDPKCSLFLISLKAGGVGLNLTAAEYVFLLDPWWNPAVEAQAIDRTHRIGQTNPVFAYRLICQGTVEEKVLELQQSKRDLAESIITADNSLIRSMKAEDLELLLT